MISELDTVILTRDIPEYGLKHGTRGVVVDRHGDELEVEFMNAVGRTIAVLPLAASDLCRLEPGAPAPAQAAPAVEDLLDDELESLEAELDRIGTGQDPATTARRTPVAGRLKAVKWLKSQCPMTTEEFERLLQRLASGELEIAGDPLKMAQRQSKELLARWKVLTSSPPQALDVPRTPRG